MPRCSCWGVRGDHTSLFACERNQVFSVFNVFCLLFQVGHELFPFERASWWLLRLIPLPEPCRQQRVLGTGGETRVISAGLHPSHTHPYPPLLLHRLSYTCWTSQSLRTCLHPAPAAPISAKTRCSFPPPAREFRHQLHGQDLHAARWMLLHNISSVLLSGGSQPSPPALPLASSHVLTTFDTS